MLLQRLPSLPSLLAPLLLTAVGCVSLTPYAEVRSAVPPENLVEVDGFLVYVEDRPAARPSADTSAGGEPVVLLHGFGASAYSWRRVVPLLADHRTVAIDLRGFGYTERPPGIEPYTAEGQIDLVLGVLDRLGIRRAHLVGHSYGGALALVLADHHRDRLASLTLVAAAHPDYLRKRRTALGAVHPLVAAYLRGWALRTWQVRRALRHSVADDGLVTPELVRAYLERLTVEGAPEAYRGLTAPLPEGPPDSSAGGGPPLERGHLELDEIALPTLVVWGTEDLVISIRDGRRAAELVPCHRFVALPGVGHLAMEEAPAALAAAIRDFLDDLGPHPADFCR